MTTLSDAQLDALLSVWFDAARPVLEDDDAAYYRGLMRDVIAKYEALSEPLLCGVENETHRDIICDLDAGHDGQHHNWAEGLAYWSTPVRTHGLEAADGDDSGDEGVAKTYGLLHYITGGSFLGSAGL